MSSPPTGQPDLGIHLRRTCDTLQNRPNCIRPSFRGLLPFPQLVAFKGAVLVSFLEAEALVILACLLGAGDVSRDFCTFLNRCECFVAVVVFEEFIDDVNEFFTQFDAAFMSPVISCELWCLKTKSRMKQSA